MVMKARALNLTFSTDALKKLIAEHPNYPIVILAGENASDGEHSVTFCSDICFEIKEILAAETPYDECVACSREYFEEKMEEWLWDRLGQNDVGVKKMPEEEFQARLHAAIAEFDPYWEKVIAIYADN